jgi:periplasmic divalent cation tolerance protein
MRVVLCSCPLSESKELARGVVSKRLAACVQIVPQVESVYWWDGEVCEDGESLLVIKTAESHVGALTEYLVAHHSYDVPEVISLPLVEGEGNPNYIEWLRGELRG